LLLEAHPDFLIVMSYNPGYQSVMKDLKHSTRQRFLAIDFTYPPSKEEQDIVIEEGQVDENTAERLVKLGKMVRNLRQQGLEEGISTRLLVYAGRLISDGVAPRAACEAAVTRAMTDDMELQEAITEIIAGIF
jgi:nitric oxide reductase NorQ protein